MIQTAPEWEQRNADRVKDSKWVVLAALLAASALGALHVVTPPNPDSAIFDYMAWRVLSGDRLYVDVIEQNWPGAVWIHMVSVALFGNTWWSFRLLDYLLLLLASSAIFWMGRKGGLRWTAWISASLYPLMYVTSTPWLTGQRDALAAHLLLIASVIHLGARGRWSSGRMSLFGLICAVVVTIRPTYLLFPALVVLLELVVHWRNKEPMRHFLQGALVAGLSFASALALLAFIGWRNGGLQGWWEATVIYNLTVYSGSAGAAEVLGSLAETVRSWHWYIGLGVIGAAVWVRTGDDRTWQVAMALACTCLVSFIVQGKAFGYHLAGLLPVLGLFSAHAIAWAIVGCRDHQPTLQRLVAVALIAVSLAGSVLKLRAILPQAQYLLGLNHQAAYLQKSEFKFDGLNMADLMQIVSYLEQHSSSTDQVLVWSRAVWINFLTERRMTLPFATVGALAGFRDSPDGLGLRWLNMLTDSFRCNGPTYVVVGVDRGWRDASTLRDFAATSTVQADRTVALALADRYHIEASIGGGQLWRRSKESDARCTKATLP